MPLRFLVSVAAILCLLAVGPAGSVADAASSKARKQQAQPVSAVDRPMNVVLVRSSEKGCEPRCPEWLMAEGRIGAETPNLLFAAYYEATEQAGGDLPVVLNSAGGNILPALQIGYFLRAKGVTVSVGSTKFDGCNPFRKPSCKPRKKDGGVFRGRAVSGQAICMSACPLILASGVSRVASPDVQLAIHHWGVERPDQSGKKPSKRLSLEVDPAWNGIVRKMITDYLTQMGNSVGMVEVMERVPFTSIYRLTPKRSREIGLVTDATGVKRLLARTACLVPDVPAYCRLRGSTAK